MHIVVFSVLWVIVALALAGVINTVRAKQGVNLNDGLTRFMTGYALGPIGFLAALHPGNVHGRGPQIFGSLVGTVGAVILFNHLF